MKSLKKAITFILSLSLISCTAFAAELSVSYGEGDRLAVSGSGFESYKVSITVAKSGNQPYNHQTSFAVLKELSASSGAFSMSAKLPASAPSGYYEAAAYDALLGEVKEIFYYCSPSLASSALTAISGGNITMSTLTANSAALGISSDLNTSLNTSRLTQYINQFKPANSLTAMQFTSAYLGAVLCGGKTSTFEEFITTIQNNAYALNCKDHVFLTYSADKQRQIFAQLQQANLSSSSFSDALIEVDFLMEVNSAATKETFSEIIFTQYKSLLNLDTSVYSTLTYPENVITALMDTQYSSANQFKSAYTKAVSDQKTAEGSISSAPVYTPSVPSSTGAASSKGSYSPDAGSAPSQTTPSASGAVFDDMTSHWAKDAVMYLKSKGIIDGVGNNLFNPEKPVTRCEFAKMIAQAFFADAQSLTGQFSDISDVDWFAQYVYALSERNIINGMGDGTFKPYASITRQDAAVIINRTAVLCGASLEAVRESVGFADKEQIADYASEAVDTLYRAQLINGVTADCFDPLSGVTRAQAAQMIYNLLTK